MDVLILEDEWLIAEEMKDQLESLGFRALGPAYNCAAALELIWRQKPDVAILDTQLGSETCEVVLEECVRQGIPVLISSGHSEAMLPDFAGDQPFISKPHATDALSRALAQLLAG